MAYCVARRCSLRLRSVSSFLSCFVDGGQLSGPFSDAVARALYSGRLISSLACFEPGVSIASPFPLRRAIANWWSARHIQDFSNSASGERIAAQHDRALIGNEGLAELSFVLQQKSFQFFFKPGRVSGYLSSRHNPWPMPDRVLIPTFDDSVRNQRCASFQIPLSWGSILCFGCRQSIDQAQEQLVAAHSRLLLSSGIRRSPAGGLFAFQPGLEIGNRHVEQVLLLCRRSRQTCKSPRAYLPRQQFLSSSDCIPIACLFFFQRRSLPNFNMCSPFLSLIDQDGSVERSARNAIVSSLLVVRNYLGVRTRTIGAAFNGTSIFGVKWRA